MINSNVDYGALVQIVYSNEKSENLVIIILRPHVVENCFFSC